MKCGPGSLAELLAAIVVLAAVTFAAGIIWMAWPELKADIIRRWRGEAV